MPFYWEWKLALGILSDWHQEPQRPQWPQQPQQPQWPQWPLQPHFIKKLTELDVSISPVTKMTYPSLLMWDGSSKIHFFIDFWHPFSWRLWRTGMLLLTKLKGHRSNFHYSGPQKAQLVDPEFKIQVTWGFQIIQTRVRTPFRCQIIEWTQLALAMFSS